MGNDAYYPYAVCKSCVCNTQCNKKGQCSIGLERCCYCAEISTQPYNYCGYRAVIEQDLKVDFSFSECEKEQKEKHKKEKSMQKTGKTQQICKDFTNGNSQGYPQDSEENEYRYLDTSWLDELARGLTAGAVKHPGETWRTIPAREHMYRALRHISIWLMGDRQEPHIINASMRLMMAFSTNGAENGK